MNLPRKLSATIASRISSISHAVGRQSYAKCISCFRQPQKVNRTPNSPTNARGIVELLGLIKPAVVKKAGDVAVL
jgi:hypothetical protein